MLGLESLSFAAPWALAALATLPVIWWLLRVLPPAPKLVRFPPVRLLFGLSGKEETPAKTPPWLIALRLALAALLIVGLAEPLLNPETGLDGDGPLILVVDDGWAAARRWQSFASLNDINQLKGIDPSTADIDPADYERQVPAAVLGSREVGGGVPRRRAALHLHRSRPGPLRPTRPRLQRLLPSRRRSPLKRLLLQRRNRPRRSRHPPPRLYQLLRPLQTPRRLRKWLIGVSITPKAGCGRTSEILAVVAMAIKPRPMLGPILGPSWLQHTFDQLNRPHPKFQPRRILQPAFLRGSHTLSHPPQGQMRPIIPPLRFPPQFLY